MLKKTLIAFLCSLESCNIILKTCTTLLNLLPQSNKSVFDTPLKINPSLTFMIWNFKVQYHRDPYSYVKVIKLRISFLKCFWFFFNTNSYKSAIPLTTAKNCSRIDIELQAVYNMYTNYL